MRWANCRGSGAGPVVTAAVIFPSDFKSDLINDSKQLSENQRNKAYNIIINNAIAYSVQAGSANLINEVGINPATFITMRKCIDEIILSFGIIPEHLLVDGTVFDEYSYNGNIIPHSCIPKGDGTYLSIGAASILAKVRRDGYMRKLHKIHPYYAWDSNVGYLSKAHIAGIKEHGINQYHRTLYVRNYVK